MPANPPNKRSLVPENVQQELLRLQVDEGWSDARLTVLLKERWGIELSRPSVNRLMNQLRAGAGKPVAPPVVEVEVEPPQELEDGQILDRVKRDLYRAERMAFRDRKFGDQVRAAQALIGLIFKQREADSPVPVRPDSTPENPFLAMPGVGGIHAKGN